MKRISMATLRRKYPHPQRGLPGQFTGYCVAGALCSEVGMVDCEFPNATQLRDAILKAVPSIEWHELLNKETDVIWAEISKVIALNDIGEFEGAWRVLGELLKRAQQ